MLFNSSDVAENSWRNPRERNFYFKILGGYVFNDFLTDPPLQDRLNAFLDIQPRYVDFQGQYAPDSEMPLESARTLRQLLDLSELKLDHSAVSFDNHLAYTGTKKESPDCH